MASTQMGRKSRAVYNGHTPGPGDKEDNEASYRRIDGFHFVAMCGSPHEHSTDCGGLHWGTVLKRIDDRDRRYRTVL